MVSIFSFLQQLVSQFNDFLKSNQTIKPQQTPPVKSDRDKEPIIPGIITSSFVNLNHNEFWFELHAEKNYSVKQQRHPIEVQSLPSLGKKLLPIFDAEWTVITHIEANSMAEAVAKFIQLGFDKKDLTIKSSTLQAKAPVKTVASPQSPIRSSSNVLPQVEVEKPKESTEGVLIWSGVRNFPDSDRPGKFYENFCVEIKTDSGTRTLQGEGLSDALAEVDAQLNTRVSVKRLGKVPVELIDKRTKKPVLDANGKPKAGYKWQWKIKPLN